MNTLPNYPFSLAPVRVRINPSNYPHQPQTEVEINPLPPLPQHPQPPPPAGSKQLKIIWLLIGAIILVICAAIGGWALYLKLSSKNPPAPMIPPTFKLQNPSLKFLHLNNNGSAAQFQFSYTLIGEGTSKSICTTLAVLGVNKTYILLHKGSPLPPISTDKGYKWHEELDKVVQLKKHEQAEELDSILKTRAVKISLHVLLDDNHTLFDCLMEFGLQEEFVRMNTCKLIQ